MLPLKLGPERPEKEEQSAKLTIARLSPIAFKFPDFQKGAANVKDQIEGNCGDMKYPGWQRPYQEALLELDKDKLKMRLTAAERAMIVRLQEIGGAAHADEREAIADAMGMLRALKTSEFSG